MILSLRPKALFRRSTALSISVNMNGSYSSVSEGRKNFLASATVVILRSIKRRPRMGLMFSSLASLSAASSFSGVGGSNFHL